MKLAYRTAGNAGAIDVKKDERQAFVPLAFRVSTKNAKAPVGKGGATAPCLLTRDDIMVAIPDSFGCDCRHVTAGARF